MGKQVKTGISFVVLGLILLGYQNCSKSTALNDNEYNDMSLAAAAPGLAVLKANCVSCHSATSDLGGVGDILDLNQLVYKRLLIPGEPDLSPIVSSIQEAAMPPGQPMSTADLDTLKEWVTTLNQDQLTGGTVPGGAAALTPTFQSVFTKIIQPKCMGCHDGTPSALMLTTYNQVRAQVVPGNPGTSDLYLSITRTTDRMPRGGAALSAEELKAVSDWIVAGAMNN